MAKNDGLGLSKPQLKSLIDSFKTISETFGEILQQAKADEEKERARKANELAAKSENGGAGMKRGNGGVTITPLARPRRSTGTQLRG